MNAMSHPAKLKLGIVLTGILLMSLMVGLYEKTAGEELQQMKMFLGFTCVGCLYVGSNLKAKNQK